MLRKLLTLAVVCLISAGVSFAQTGSLTGTVTEANSGEALVGANVYIPDLQRGAPTDANGQYTISDIPVGTYEVRISYVGYTEQNQTVDITSGENELNAALQSGVALDEMVVTALGQQRQSRDLAYSAQNMDVDEVTRSGNDNIMSALSGRVAGMRVEKASGMGGSTDIILRGENSLTGDNQALMVVDGVPYANQRFNTASQEAGFDGYDYGNTGIDVNPQNIESMTILKGPAAAALYGSRGANGAIIIETKKGSPGQDLVNVRYNASIGASMVNESTFPTYQMEYGQGYGGGLYYQANPFPENIDADSVYTTRYDADASFGPAFDPDQMVLTWESFDPTNPNYGQLMPYEAPENQPVEFFETATNVQNSILINGGIADGGYYSLGYTQNNDRGVLPNSSLDKYKLSFSGGYEVNEDFTVDASINYSKTEGIGRPARGYSTIMSEMRQWWGTNVDVMDQKAAYFRANQNATWNLTGDRSGPFYWNNPYFERYENFASDTRDRYTGYAQADYQVLDWLNISGQVSLDSFTSLIEERNAVGSTGVSEYERRTREYAEYNYRMQANYNKQLTEQFSIDGLVGFNILRRNIQGIEASTNGGLVVPGLYSLNNSVNSILYPDETEENLGINGLMASLNLNYGGYLNVALTGRRDKASSLPEDNNVYYYPSASVGFTFSEFINSDALSFGKLRASWAQVGNTAPVYSLTDTYNRRANFGSAGLYSLPGQKNNPTLKPEITKSWEVGMQLGFINDRIFIDATYYDENTINQIFPINISGASGYTSRYINAGNVENRGISLGVTGRPVTGSDFSWTINANWNKNMSEIKSLAPGVDFFQQARTQGVVIGSKVGDPYGVIRGTDFVYHENGEPIVDPETGMYEISESSEVVIGDKNPDWRAGISNQFDYKNFSLNFLVDVRWGGDIFSLDQWYGQGTGLYPITAGTNDLGNPKRNPLSEGGGVVLPGVNPDGSANETRAPVTTYAGAYGWVNSPNARYVYDGSFVKLREVGLTYNFSPETINSIGVLSGASVSVTGRNLWIIHKNIPHADPEQTLGAGNLGGYQGGNMPALRNVTFNFQLNF